MTLIGEDQYVFFVHWNSLDQAWYFDLREYDETPIAVGIKIVLGAYLSSTVNHPLLLDGVFFARSNATRHVDAGFDDLGVTVQVYYYSRADMIAQLLAIASGA